LVLRGAEPQGTDPEDSMSSSPIVGTIAPAAAGVTVATFANAPWWVATAGISASVVIDLHHRHLTHRERLAVIAGGSTEHGAAMLKALNPGR
jgi:hypothetical protein